MACRLIRVYNFFMDTELEPKIQRLVKLIGTDEGFYILALHSFVEYYLREVRSYGEEPRFGDLTWRFREELLAQYGDGYIDGLSSLAQLGKQHNLTNRVRHSFSEIDPEEARAATSMFLRFCRLAGISGARQLKLFNDHLQSWAGRESPAEQSIIIRTLQKELKALKKSAGKTAGRLEEFEDVKKQLSMLRLKLSAKEMELEEYKKTAGEKNAKADELRQQRFELKEKINSLLAEREKYTDLQRYLDYLGRLTVYTRSRLDYERLIAQLSPEQQSVVDSISFRHDFFIRGTAGTGKSLVLISAMQRVLAQQGLDFYQENPVIFITYTRTLVKYSSFTAGLMKMKIPPVLFSTVDTLIFDKLHEFGADFVYDFGIAEEFASGCGCSGSLGVTELAAELDEFLLGRLVKRSEYVDMMIQRDGLPGSPDSVQRAEIWELLEKYTAFMEEQKRYSINYGRVKLFRQGAENARSGEGRGFQAVFIDEVQDLNPAALAAVKSLTYGPLIMAGDFQQTLYMTQHPFVRAGIDIRGATRVLKTNFRNTRQVIEKAEAFLYRGSPADDSAALSFREGPPAELFRAGDIEQMKDLLSGRLRLFLSELGYDPENICVLVPRNRYIEELENLLAEAGTASVKVNSEDFDFVNRGSINLSTLHSCKGLDFPVILLFLPELARLEKFSEAQNDILLRNLIYTGMSRAMDHLNIILPDSDDPILADLAAVFDLEIDTDTDS